MARFDARRLAGILEAQLLHRGVLAESSSHVAKSLIETSLRGVDSHGINLFPYYVSAVEGGRINRAPRMQVVNQQAALAQLDADHGFGHHAGSRAIEIAINMASVSGAGMVGVRNSTHFGAAAYFAHQASRRGYAALALTNADALVKASGAGEALFGTNPICFSAPMAGEEPFCLDMATSRVSWNKVANKRRSREAMPDGWACDEAGKPTNDPEAARMLEPSGGYKGYGLGMMVEILCAGLVDGPWDKDLLPMYGSPINARRPISHFFLVIDIKGFTDPVRFARRLRDLAERVRSVPPADASSVMVPGDPEKKAFERRTTEGIPVAPDKYAEFMAISADFESALLP